MSYAKLVNKGRNACIDRIGRDFCKQHGDTAVFAHGKTEEGEAYCFLGVSDMPFPNSCRDGRLVLDGKTPWPYYTSCVVGKDGCITWGDEKLPDCALARNRLYKPLVPLGFSLKNTLPISKNED